MKTILNVVLLLATVVAAQAQNAQVAKIRQMYAEAKKQIQNNGRGGQAPLDLTVSISDATEVDEDFTIYDETQLTFYFNKYRVNAELDYPDASSCYFITEDWSANGHTRYREMLFDTNEGNLLFSYVRQETHAGYVVESRYYFDADGKLVEQKHKEGGKDVVRDDDEWNSADSERELAKRYLEIFDGVMNPGSLHLSSDERMAAANPERMKLIRSTYAQAKAKIADSEKEMLAREMSVVVRDQTWGPPSTTEQNFYFDYTVRNGNPEPYCYFIAEHRHHNNMGPDLYSEYLFAPVSPDLMFAYTSAKEEGEHHEWRYYYDERGQCFEAKTDADEHDSGNESRAQAYRLLKTFRKLAALN